MTESLDVLFVNPAGWQKESINLGLCYLASAVGKAGFSRTILDANYAETADEDLLDRAVALKPRFVAISAKTATANEAARLARLLRARLPGTVFAVGGPHATLCPETYLEVHPEFDYAFLGEAEESLPRFLAALFAGEDVAACTGIAHRRDAEIVVNPWSPPHDLDALPFPDLDAIEGFSWKGFRYPLLSSRGCPYSCIYCCVNKLTGSRKWRARSAENVLAELTWLAREKGVRAFEVWDDNFTLDMKRAKAVCRGLIDRKLEMNWYCHNGIRADKVDAELAGLMKGAGCFSIAFGMETGHPETFDSIKKGEPLQAVVDAVGLVKAAGIKAVGYFIIGLPGDTLEKFIETVRFQRSLKLDHHVFGMLIPYPKTEVWDIVQREGTIFKDITETQHFSDTLVPVCFETPGFPKADMIRAYHIARYFDFFEAVDAVRSAGKRPTAVYLVIPELFLHLPGLIAAAGQDVRHIVVTPEELSKVQNLEGLAQLPDGVAIEWIRAQPAGIPPGMDEGATVLLALAKSTTKGMFARNLRIALFNPDNPLKFVELLRTHYPDLARLPGPVQKVVGLARSLPNVTRFMGLGKLLASVFFVNRIKYNLRILVQIARFNLTKYELLRSRPRRVFGKIAPYDRKDDTPYL